ncbi:NifU family protein [Thioalkalivibrio sp. ALE19]|uniref:NifU family protein n=1 Tax=Thioalkalivibrio sp. ALE19 TaxID=1266909 RepID=UPI0004199FE6|nr:NifU family protein [Thioalkalivibrio sp. ALE19]
MPRSSAPPLRLRLHPDPGLARRILAGQVLLSTAVVLYALVYGVWWTWPAAGVLVAAAFGWSRRGRQPHFDWLGCTAHGRWWLATAEGLRQERIHDIEILPDTRVFATRVVLRYRPAGGGRPGTLWLYPGRVDADDLRRSRMRLRWPAPGPAESGEPVRPRDVIARGVAILTALRASGGRIMAGDQTRPDNAQVMVDVSHLLKDDPDHVYSEEELDAIEELDPELALRLDRAQTHAAREQADVPADGPIDEDAVREAIEEARRIMMQDGGDIEFVELDGRTVRVRLKGACVGCPRSTLDLKNVVERLVRSRAPGVASVANTF